MRMFFDAQENLASSGMAPFTVTIWVGVPSSFLDVGMSKRPLAQAWLPGVLATSAPPTLIHHV